MWVIPTTSTYKSCDGPPSIRDIRKDPELIYLNSFFPSTIAWLVLEKPHWNMLVKLDHFPRDRDENQKCLKTTTQPTLYISMYDDNPSTHFKAHL